MKEIGIRWTIGDVSDRGFEALRLSVWGAFQVFGPRARYAICVNSVDVGAARRRCGDLPPEVRWISVTRAQIPARLRARLDAGMAEGVGWKFAPLRLFPGAWELALDNDCILWRMPRAVSDWLEDPAPSFVIAEDVRPCFGQFAPSCAGAPRNSGIRGLPPGFDLLAAFDALFAEHPVLLKSELDEQGLQVAAVERTGRARVVRVEEVSICSPFPPHLPYLGTCGAHFVGLNARRLGWTFEGRPAEAWTEENWRRQQPEIELRVGRVPAGVTSSPPPPHPPSP